MGPQVEWCRMCAAVSDQREKNPHYDYAESRLEKEITDEFTDEHTLTNSQG